MNDTLDFLQKWQPGGPWVVTAIGVDRKSMETRTFDQESAFDLIAWLGENDGERNLYFNVNPTKEPVSKKTDKLDMAALAWLHVDVDPREGEDIAAEQARILALFQSPPPGIPPATCVVYSGGGYQAFWKLADPAVLTDLASIELAERYNRQLEVIFDADHCFNVDRVMRLPGTLNVPDAKKRAKGRKTVRASLVEFHVDRVYSLEEFTAAPPKQVAANLGWAAGSLANAPGNVRRLSSVDELPSEVLDRTKVIIVQGLDPDDPERYPSRSEWLFCVVCDLIRANVSDETIFSVITDPDFGISASVLDKGQRSERYAMHQIESAREHAVHPVLRELNARFAVIGNLGGKCRIIEEVADEAFGGRTRVSKQSFEDFRNRYLHKKVAVGKKDGQPVFKPMGAWWLQHEMRKQFEKIVFSPGREVEGAFNLWRGFTVDARPGDCSLFLGHLHENICSGNDEHYNYLLGWMAMAVQHPARPGETAVVLRGRQGTGKSFFVKMFGSLFGRHFLQVADAKHLTGAFNAHMRDCVILFGDEAFYAGDKKHESTLKMLVTEENIVYEAKGVDSEMGPNFTHIFLASNSTWVVPAGGEERRYFVLDVAAHRMQNGAYFEAIRQQMDEGGREALLHMLQTYPLDGFSVRTVPKTEALADQKLHSLGPEEEWWYGKLVDGKLVMRTDQWPGYIPRQELYEDYVLHMQKVARNYRASPTVLGRFLRRVMPRGKFSSGYHTITMENHWVQEETVSHSVHCYNLPSLEDCREHWRTTYGSFGDF